MVLRLHHCRDHLDVIFGADSFRNPQITTRATKNDELRTGVSTIMLSTIAMAEFVSLASDAVASIREVEFACKMLHRCY